MGNLILNIQEKVTLSNWKKAIKDVYGEEGSFYFIVTPGAIGTKIEVYSDLADTSKDITDYETW